MVTLDLSNRIAIVTGASRGIGQAIAETYAEHGAEVILVSRKQEELEKVADGIRAKGGKAQAMACNMSDIKGIENLYQNIEKTYGKLDILVNNAAANPYFGEMASIDVGAYEKTLDVNLKGPFFMVQKAIPLMKAAGKGAILNVSSVNGIRPTPFQGVYSISKGALITMTLAYAQELGPHNIRVNALMPGLTDTKFASVLMNTKEIYDMAISMVPMHRHAEPSEMVGAALYLVSDAASYTTGTCLICDGGMHI